MTVLVGAVVLAVILFAVVVYIDRLSTRARRQAEHQQWLRDAELAIKAGAHVPVADGWSAIHERLWPGNLCAYPPCSPEDGWMCDQHQRHAVHVITDLPDPSDPRWSE